MGDFSPSHVIGWETVCRHADEVVSGVWRVSEGRVASGFLSYDVFDCYHSMCAHAVVDTGSEVTDFRPLAHQPRANFGSLMATTVAGTRTSLTFGTQS